MSYRDHGYVMLFKHFKYLQNIFTSFPAPEAAVYIYIWLMITHRYYTYYYTNPVRDVL